FTRDALVALLRSPHFVLGRDGAEIPRHSTSALDRALSARRYLGDRARLEALAAEWSAPQAAAALDAAVATAGELAPLADEAPAATQVERLLSFWTTHLRAIDDRHPSAARERRARAAIADMLRGLASVHAAHDRARWTIELLALHVRRAIEDQTFDVESRQHG